LKVKRIKGKYMQERKMTKSEKSKEKRLKDKYDDSGMKASMKKQYGKDWEKVYYATIRKKAMGKKKTEGYSILPPIDRDRYQTRKGLEGPFQTKSGKPVYYDPKEGAYYDPDTDMYLTYDEWKALDEANRPPQPQPPRTTPVTPTPTKPEPQYTDAIARAAQQAGQYDDTYVPPTPEPDLPPPGDPDIKPNVDDILRDLDRQYGTGDEFMPRDEDDIGNPRPPRDPSSFGPGGQPIPDPTPDPAPYTELPDPMDDLLGPDDGDITPPDPAPAQDPNPAGDDGATDIEGEGKPGPDDFEQERYLDGKGTTSNVGVKGARGKKEFAIATVGGKETKVYGDRATLRAKYPDAPIFNADGTNESITMDARRKLNSIFEKALSEFEFNPNAGHRDQPSHPENRGLTNPRSTSPRPQLRPGSDRSTSPRPKLRPKDVEMRAAIDAALRQAMGEGKLTEEEYNWWDKFLGRDKARNNPFRDSSGKPLSMGARAWPEPGEYEDPQGFRAGKYADYDMSELPTTRTIHGDTIASNRGDSTVSNATGRNSTVSNADGDYYYSDVPGYEKRPRNKVAYRDPNTGEWKTESVNEWGGDDQYEAAERAIENALSIFDEMLDNREDELRARAEAHDYLKGELGDLGVTHGDMESKQYHSELEKEIVQIMNRRDKGMEENNLPASTAGFRSGIRFRSGGRASGPVSQSTYDREMAAFNRSKTAPKPKAPKMFNGHRTEGHSPHKKGTAKYKAHMAAMHAGMNEGEEKPYICVHAKKGKHECRAESSYAAAKKAAAHWGLKSTAGIDAHLAIDEGKYGKKKKKKSKKYEQVDINKLKESINMKNATDNQAVASYVRTMLDESYDSWAKIHNQVHFVIDLLAEGHNVNAKQVLDILSKTNIQEQLDRKMKVSENVSMMRKIVADKSALPVKFKDSTMKVDMTTANIFLQVFDQQKPETQEKIMDKIETKNGFLKILDIIYDRLK
jgi:hypothetical protein